MNENKKDIAALLSEEIVFQTPTGKIIVTTGGLQMKMVLNSNDNKIDLSGLKASHQEAVPRIGLHAIHCSQVSACTSVVISASDTDVLSLPDSFYSKINIRL